MVADEESYSLNATHVVVGGILMFAACLFVVSWYRSSTLRQFKIDDLQRRMDSEKAVLLVQSAKESARAERELNGTMVPDGHARALQKFV